jgi:hypothetical protein
MSKQPRGIRNNNPGNIRYNGIDWRGLANPPSDGVFCVFIAPQYGIRALAKVIRNYHFYYGIRSIKGIVNRFAPGTENNTAAYIDHVCKITGFDESIQLDLENDDIILALMRAIIIFENGQQPYTDDELKMGMKC